MPHATPLIATIVAGIVVAFLLGALAQRLRLPVLIGYLLAGVLVGPFTPGYVADQAIANELAELGVILLMFGVGLHFSIKDLMAVRAIAIPGAIAQVAVATAMGWALGYALGWSSGAGLIFGLALSVASTVVLLRAMQERNLIETTKGRIAVGWLIVEDLVMVLALVIIPAVAGGIDGSGGMATVLAVTLGKVAAFVALMLVIGSRVVPWLLRRVAQSGSRELFRLAVLAVALGVALGAALLFGVSFALGAFFAGVILAETPFSHRAAEETLPLRDAFAVLFFVSVGMLFNPRIVIDAPLALAGTIAIIVVGKSIAALLIVRMFGRSMGTAMTIAASLAQIGEFSFILATLGGKLGLLPKVGSDLILAGAIFSIMLNPGLFALLDRFMRGSGSGVAPPVDGGGHVVVIGHGRVGSRVVDGLLAEGERVTVIELEPDRDSLPNGSGARVVTGNAAAAATIIKAKLNEARLLLLTIPPGYEAGEIARRARQARPDLPIIARVHSDAEAAEMSAAGASLTIMGESEIARRMIEQARGDG